MSGELERQQQRQLGLSGGRYAQAGSQQVAGGHGADDQAGNGPRACPPCKGPLPCNCAAGSSRRVKAGTPSLPATVAQVQLQCPQHGLQQRTQAAVQGAGVEVPAAEGTGQWSPRQDLEPAPKRARCLPPVPAVREEGRANAQAQYPNYQQQQQLQLQVQQYFQQLHDQRVQEQRQQEQRVMHAASAGAGAGAPAPPLASCLCAAPAAAPCGCTVAGCKFSGKTAQTEAAVTAAGGATGVLGSLPSDLLVAVLTSMPDALLDLAGHPQPHQQLRQRQQKQQQQLHSLQAPFSGGCQPSTMPTPHPALPLPSVQQRALAAAHAQRLLPCQYMEAGAGRLPGAGNHWMHHAIRHQQHQVLPQGQQQHHHHHHQLLLTQQETDAAVNALDELLEQHQDHGRLACELPDLSQRQVLPVAPAACASDHQQAAAHCRQRQAELQAAVRHEMGAQQAQLQLQQQQQYVAQASCLQLPTCHTCSVPLQPATQPLQAPLPEPRGEVASVPDAQDPAQCEESCGSHTSPEGHAMHSAQELLWAVAKLTLCPLSQTTMADPVVAADGYTYERRNILLWFQRSLQSPVTGQLITSYDLKPNRTVKALVALLRSAGSCGDGQ